jgi:type III restriction enzyme
VRAIRYRPVSDEILVQDLHDRARYRLRIGGDLATEARLEDDLVLGLVDDDDISYDDHAELLYKLSTSRMNEFGVSGHNRFRYIPFGCDRED